MAASPEHTFITEALTQFFERMSETKMFGVTEAERRTFDTACVLQRDLSRPLVAQVLWNHDEGIEKDLRTLLHDREAILKLYLARDTIKVRLRLDEILKSYRGNPNTKSLLQGLRIILLPSEFDADREDHRSKMGSAIEAITSRDILFDVLLGKLGAFDFRVFAGHGGPFGLKIAALHLINREGLLHTPTFKNHLGYKTDGPIRNCTTMLYATGLIKGEPISAVRLPSLKGRAMIDLISRLIYESQQRVDWGAETALTMKLLGVDLPLLSHVKEMSGQDIIGSPVALLLREAEFAASRFGVDLLDGIDIADPKFYSPFNWSQFANGTFPVQIGELEEPDNFFLSRTTREHG